MASVCSAKTKNRHSEKSNARYSLSIRPLSGLCLGVFPPRVGVLVLVRVEALARDLDFDLAVALDLRLAAEARGGADVERLVEDVVLFVFHLAEQVRSLDHVDVTGRAGADAATRVALGGLERLRRFENRGTHRHVDFPISLE